MATTVNFDSLKNDITAYLERGASAQDDPTVYNQIPRLINAAERKIIQFLKLQGTLEALTTTLAVNVSVVAKPDRWRQTVSINYGAGSGNNVRTPLFPRSYEYCRAYWPDSTQLAPPEFYADYDYQHWLIVGTPDAGYPAEMLCYMQPVLLDDGNQSNFFTNYTPNLLLYGALLEAEPFLKDDPRIPVWQGFWDKEAQSLSGNDLQKILDRSAQRERA